MKQDKFSNYATNAVLQKSGGLTIRGTSALRRIPKKGGKAGLAIAGLAAAGGLGVAGVKALKDRKASKTVGGRIKKAQSQVANKINNTAIAKKMGVKVSRMK